VKTNLSVRKNSIGFIAPLVSFAERRIIKVNVTQKNNNLSSISEGRYSELPKDDYIFIRICDELVRKKDYQIHRLVTGWIKKRKTLFDLKYMDIYQKWLFEIVDDWGACDILCYRVLNPMVEKYPCLYNEVYQWSISDKPYVKRAAAVCLLHSSQTFKVSVPFEVVTEVADNLIEDKNIYVQNGVGWLLKYSYMSYPKQTIEYLKKSSHKMNARIFNYALEKFNEQDKDDMKAYRKKL